MTVKHTPGPWRACLDGECSCGYVFGDDGNVYVAKALGPDDEEEPHPTREVQKANARLIAAAPYLLVAAEAALDHLEHLELRGILVSEAVIEALSYAIAKARGNEVKG